MKTRTLGRTGFDVSEIGLGCWQLGNDFGEVKEEVAQEILQQATQSAITFLDTADVYGGGLSEERIGQWLKTQSHKPYITTKVGRNGELFPNGYQKSTLRKSLEGSLRRLDVEVLDLAQLHCIPTDVLLAGDVLAWMEDFQQEGLIRHFGASVEMIDEALFCVKHPQLATIQIIFNVFRQDAIESLLPQAEENNVGVIVRLPLASGLLSGKMQKSSVFAANDHRHYNKDGAMFHVGETFNGIPFEQGVDLVDELKSHLPSSMALADVALRWILDQSQVSTIIAGASRLDQVVANAAVSDQPSLPSQLHTQLNTFYQTNVKQHIRGGI